MRARKTRAVVGLLTGLVILATTAAAPGAIVQGDLLTARTNDTAIALKPDSLAWSGEQTAYGIHGVDISMGAKYAYLARDNSNTVVRLDKGTLQYTGVESTDYGVAFTSVDVGADGYVYAARGDSQQALKLDPVTLAWTGVQSSHAGVDISVGIDFAYLARGADTLIQLDKDTLQYTGIQTPAAWGPFSSVDVGLDGYVYAARGAAQQALKLDPLTLAWTTIQSSHVGVDISMGTDFAYLARGNDTLLQLDKNTLQWTGVQTIPSFDNLVSVDMVPVPEPASLVLLAMASIGLLASRRWKPRE